MGQPQVMTLFTLTWNQSKISLSELLADTVVPKKTAKPLQSALNVVSRCCSQASSGILNEKLSFLLFQMTSLAAGLSSSQKFTYTSGQTADVYQVNKYWQSADSCKNSGMPSLACWLQWKKIVDDTTFVLSLPHTESDENSTSKSSSTKWEGEKMVTSCDRNKLHYKCSELKEAKIKLLQLYEVEQCNASYCGRPWKLPSAKCRTYLSFPFPLLRLLPHF